MAERGRPRGTAVKRKSNQTKADTTSLRAALAVQIEAVMGERQQRDDGLVVGAYERDRALCEAAIERAQTELNDARDEFDLAWKWHELDEAFVRLAHVESRMRLARRRA